MDGVEKAGGRNRTGRGRRWRASAGVNDAADAARIVAVGDGGGLEVAVPRSCTGIEGEGFARSDSAASRRTAVRGGALDWVLNVDAVEVVVVVGAVLAYAVARVGLPRTLCSVQPQ